MGDDRLPIYVWLRNVTLVLAPPTVVGVKTWCEEYIVVRTGPMSETMDKYKAATVIQAYFRGHLARKEYARELLQLFEMVIPCMWLLCSDNLVTTLP